MTTTFTRILIVFTLALVGCGESGEAETSDPGTTPAASAPGAETEPVAPQQAGTPNAFVGHYHYHGSNSVVMVLNSHMQVRMGPQANPCRGSYTLEDGAIQITYDEGQSNCMTMSSAGRLSDDGQQVRFGILATYDRDDSADETF